MNMSTAEEENSGIDLGKLPEQEEESSAIDLGKLPEQEEESAVIDLGKLPELEESEDESIIEAYRDTMEKDPERRSWRDAEHISDYFAMMDDADYKSQQIFLRDENGKALQDENGNYILGNRREKGSIVTDHVAYDDDGKVRIIEDKYYTNADALIRNIREQTRSRREAFGEDVSITYRLLPNHSREGAYTFESIDKIQAACEEEGVEFEFLYE